MKRMSGALATQTPPCPTATPEGMFRPSAKIVNLSAAPSPSVSSSTLTRSRPSPAELRGYSRLSVIQMRPRSSKVMATGLTISGSLATSSTTKPSGTVIFLIASAGVRAGPGGLLWPWGMDVVCRPRETRPPTHQSSTTATAAEAAWESPAGRVRGKTRHRECDYAGGAGRIQQAGRCQLATRRRQHEERGKKNRAKLPCEHASHFRSEVA